MPRKRRKPKWRLNPRELPEWADDVTSLAGDILPDERMIAVPKRYSSDVPATSALTIIGAAIAVIGVYAYLTNKPPSPPVG